MLAIFFVRSIYINRLDSPSLVFSYAFWYPVAGHHTFLFKHMAETKRCGGVLMTCFTCECIELLNI